MNKSAKWWKEDLANDLHRYTLTWKGAPTPYFIYRSRYAGEQMNYRYGLYGAGMAPTGIALFLEGADKLADLKARAEHRAEADHE